MNLKTILLFVIVITQSVTVFGYDDLHAAQNGFDTSNHSINNYNNQQNNTTYNNYSNMSDPAASNMSTRDYLSNLAKMEQEKKIRASLEKQLQESKNEADKQQQKIQYELKRKNEERQKVEEILSRKDSNGWISMTPEEGELMNKYKAQFEAQHPELAQLDQEPERTINVDTISPPYSKIQLILILIATILPLLLVTISGLGVVKMTYLKR